MPAETLTTPTRETREVPRAALRVPVAPFALAKGDQADAGHRFAMLARSNEPVDHWWWGLIYHDFDGMRHGDTIAVDYLHDDAQIIGFADTFDVVADGLQLGGELIPLADNDTADKIVKLAGHGVPYEASIQWDEQTALEWIAEGLTAQVNGRTVAGPCVIARQWNLRGVAVCPHGYDRNTETKFAHGGKAPAHVTLFTKDGPMPNKLGKPAAPPAEQLTDDQPQTEAPETPEADDVETPATPASDDVETPEADGPDGGQLSAERRELQQFVKAFGAENGAHWFSESVSFTDAQGKHIQVLTDKLAAAEAKAAELQTKLSQVQLGEADPVAGGAAPSEAGKPNAAELALGGNIAKAAAAITMPGRK